MDTAKDHLMTTATTTAAATVATAAATPAALLVVAIVTTPVVVVTTGLVVSLCGPVAWLRLLVVSSPLQYHSNSTNVQVLIG